MLCRMGGSGIKHKGKVSFALGHFPEYGEHSKNSIFNNYDHDVTHFTAQNPNFWVSLLNVKMTF